MSGVRIRIRTITHSVIRAGYKVIGAIKGRTRYTNGRSFRRNLLFINARRLMALKTTLTDGHGQNVIRLSSASVTILWASR